MKKSPKRYTVTAALPYANGPVHIGHLAGCYLPADIYVRYLRRNNRDVKFICGTDEHGVAVMMKARAEGLTPKQLVDKYHGIIKGAFQQIGLTFDIFSRTSKSIHHETAQGFFKNLYDKGIFIEKETEQYYDVEAEQFLADRYIEGTCPNCGFEKAYGDQCESCGSTLNATDLINPRSRLSGQSPEKRLTRQWFLPLDTLSEKIKNYVVSHSEWKPNVYGQCMSWLNDAEGLQPRSMTRDLNWGIPVPLPEAQGKVLYVWFDAPIGYISATRELLGDEWKPYWQDRDTALIHFIGKDNIVFHCIIFPSVLMEHGDYILPENVPANEFLNLEGQKISTSRNWAVWLHEYVKEFPGKEDVLRYVLCANAPETKDNDFTWQDFQARNNNELVAILGNFVNRVMVLMGKYYKGAIPQPGAFTGHDNAVLEMVEKAPENIGTEIERYKFRMALQRYMEIARTGNKYLAEEEPWKKVKTDPERTQTIMYVAAQVAAQLAQLAEPFMPFTAQKLLDSLHLEFLEWTQCARQEFMAPGHQVERGELLFEKVEDKTMAEQRAKLEISKAQNEKEQKDTAEKTEASPLPPLGKDISFDDFAKLDLRVGTILAAEPVPKTDRLLKLTVDIGLEQRTIVSGIASFFNSVDLPGRQVVVVANLAPKKLRGVVSHGMILMAENSDGKLEMINPAQPQENGAVVR